MGRLRKLRPIRGLRRSQVSLSSNSLSSKLAFRQPTWTASCRCRAVATNPQNSWKARRIRFQRFQYPRIVRDSSPAEFGQHRRPMETCFSRGHVASMESVTYTARNTRFPANLDSGGSDPNISSILDFRPRLLFQTPSREGAGCPFKWTTFYFTPCPIPSCPAYEPNSKDCEYSQPFRHIQYKRTPSFRPIATLAMLLCRRIAR